MPSHKNKRSTYFHTKKANFAYFKNPKIRFKKLKNLPFLKIQKFKILLSSKNSKILPHFHKNPFSKTNFLFKICTFFFHLQIQKKNNYQYTNNHKRNTNEAQKFAQTQFLYCNFAQNGYIDSAFSKSLRMTSKFAVFEQLPPFWRSFVDGNNPKGHGKEEEHNAARSHHWLNMNRS
jgi:hypothetical protein